MTSSTNKITKPHKNDIIPGPGNSRHPGNKLYVDLVDSKKKAFIKAGFLADPKRGKYNVVMEVYNGFPGRFLEQENKKGPYYAVMSKEKAIQKIRTALSKNNQVMIENMKKNGEISCSKDKGKKLTKRKLSKIDEITPAEMDTVYSLLLRIDDDQKTQKHN